MGRMAYVALYVFAVYCLASIIVDRRSYKKPEEILWYCLLTHGAVECTGYLVGLECQPGGSITCLFCEEPFDVHSLVVVSFYEEIIGQGNWLRIIDRFLAHV